MTATLRQRARARLARTLVTAARRLDPPHHPYGEWDPKLGKLVIKIPDGAGGGLPLAHINISAGQIQDTR